MSQFNFPLKKILNIKLRERDSIQNKYLEAVRSFEVIGVELYQLLKKKETFELEQTIAFNRGVRLHEIQANQNYIDKLTFQIEQAQRKLQKARIQMDELNAYLQSKSIEVKKYEKLEEKFQKNLLDEMNRLDQINMDEISSIRSAKGLG